MFPVSTGNVCIELIFLQKRYIAQARRTGVTEPLETAANGATAGNSLRAATTSAPCPAIGRKRLTAEEERETHQQQAGEMEAAGNLSQKSRCLLTSAFPQTWRKSGIITIADSQRQRVTEKSPVFCIFSSNTRFRAADNRACRDRAGQLNSRGQNRPALMSPSYPRNKS